jgi:hypothetical protein
MGRVATNSFLKHGEALASLRDALRGGRFTGGRISLAGAGQIRPPAMDFRRPPGSRELGAGMRNADLGGVDECGGCWGRGWDCGRGSFGLRPRCETKVKPYTKRPRRPSRGALRDCGGNNADFRRLLGGGLEVGAIWDGRAGKWKVEGRPEVSLRTDQPAAEFMFKFKCRFKSCLKESLLTQMPLGTQQLVCLSLSVAPGGAWPGCDGLRRVETRGYFRGVPAGHGRSGRLDAGRVGG